MQLMAIENNLYRLQSTVYNITSTSVSYTPVTWANQKRINPRIIIKILINEVETIFFVDVTSPTAKNEMSTTIF